MAEIGKKYRVHIEDCCVRIEFTAILVSKDEPEEFMSKYWFDNGVLLEPSSSADFEELRQ